MKKILFLMIALVGVAFANEAEAAKVALNSTEVQV